MTLDPALPPEDAAFELLTEAWTRAFAPNNEWQVRKLLAASPRLRAALAPRVVHDVRPKLQLPDEGALAGPPAVDADADDMCPNCVTPWKCNGPHLHEQTIAGKRAAPEAAEPAPSLDDGLSEAWAEVESLLPSDHRLGVKRSAAYDEQYVAWTGRGFGPEGVGSSPLAALRALAERLRSGS